MPKYRIQIGKVSVKSMIIQNDKISLTAGGTEAMKQKDVPVPFAREGKISSKSMEATMDCAVQPEKGSSVVYTEAELKQLNNNTVGSSDDEIMSPADFISRCMTGEDAKALSQEETPLEEYTSSQLERAISRVKEQRSKKQEAVEGQVEKEQEIQQSREDALAETDEYAAMVSAVQDLTSQGMKFFIGNELSVTPENISGSVYGGAGQPELRARTDFSEVKDQVADILSEEESEVTEETMKRAQWLYENDLPVTEENVGKMEVLEELKNLPADKLLARIMDSVADGMLPEKANLMKWSEGEAEEAIQSLLSTDDNTLRRTFTTEADFIQAKRQLEEIRLAMTTEAARTMSAKGISLDVTNLQKIVEELKVQEQQAKEALLEETGLPVTADNAELMTNSLQAAKEVLAAPVELLGKTIETADSETLTSMAQKGGALREEYEKAAQIYEAVGTEVRRDLGDSIQKAFRNVEDILKELGLENSAANQRAVRILGYNQMELTGENVQEMKAYDARVTTLMEQMKPQVVARLIEDEINPLEISLDELETAVNERYAQVADEDISFRKFLWKMDHQGNISEEERQSMIGVYRLLDKIQKSDGAVIGQVVKEGRELSLSAFLSATRTRRAEGLDVSIDENFGALEQVNTSGTSISEQIGAAYAKTLASRLQKNISPKFMQDEDSRFMDMSLETLLENCQSYVEEGMDAYYEQMAAELKEIMADSEGQIQRFLQRLELPDMIGFRMAAKEYMSGQRPGTNRLWTEAESDEVRENFDAPEKLDELCEKIDGAHEELLEKEKESDDITYDGVVSLARMAGSISFYRSLRSHQMYDVPIVTEQGVTSCHVTIQNGGKQKGTVEISMESEEMGRVQATFRVNAGHVKGFVTAEKAESLKECQGILKRFEKDLEEMGFTMDSDSLIQGNRTSLHAGDRVTGTRNRELYQVAKCFITNVARKDDEK